MYEKLCEILDTLKNEYGYKVRALGNMDGWGIQVDYIEEGPRFDYYVHLNDYILKNVDAAGIAKSVAGVCKGVMIDLEENDL